MTYSRLKIILCSLLLVLVFCSSCGASNQPSSDQKTEATPFQKYQVDFRQGQTNNWTISGNYEASSEGLKLVEPNPGDSMPGVVCPVKIPHTGSYKLTFQAIAGSYSFISLSGSSQNMSIILYPSEISIRTNQEHFSGIPIAKPVTGVAIYELDISEQRYQFQINNTVITQRKLSPYFTGDMTFSITNDRFTLVTFSIEEM